MNLIDNEILQFLNKLTICKEDKQKANIISLDLRRGSYYIKPEDIGEFMNLLNKARRFHRKSHFLEKQNPELSGIFLDFDFIYDKPNLYSKLNNVEIQNLISIIFQEISSHTDDDVSTFMFILKKPKPQLIDGHMKDGLHILLPKFMTTKPHKKYLIEQLRSNVNIQKLFREHGISNYERCIDPATAQNPSCLYGSCKDVETAEPYILVNIYKFEFNKYLNQQQIYYYDLKEFEASHNLVYDLSLSFPSDDEYNTSEEFIDTYVITLNDRVASCIAEINSSNDLDELSELVVSDYDARIVKSLIDILLPKYYNNFEEWMNVLFALHSMGEEFKILAMYFSQKSNKFDHATFERTWNSIGNRKNGLSKSTLYFYAKESNPDAYKKIVQEESVDIAISDSIFRTNGNIMEDDISKILKILYGDRYVYEPSEKQWFELILNKKGANFEYYGKYKPTSNSTSIKDTSEAPITLQKKIKDKKKFHNLFEKQYDILNEKYKASKVSTTEDDESQEKLTENIIFLKNKLTSLKKSIEKFCTTSMLNKVFGSKQACIDFYREGFIASLDVEPYILGVNGGILNVNHMDYNNPGSIQTSSFRTYDPIHNVSKSTKSNFEKFDPYNPTPEQLRILNCIKDIIVERDARLWILLFMSTALRADMKQPLILFWEGSGSNGKTFLVQLWSTCIGDYGTKIRSTILTSSESTASGANSALCMIKDMRACFVDEFNRRDILNTRSLKELASSNGKIATRDLYKKESIVDVKCTIIVATNYPPTIGDRDDGTWRRIAKYISKKKFINGTPRTKFEQRADPQFAPELTNRQEYRDTMLSILDYFNLMFLIMFDYNIAKVQSKTIQRETRNERYFQDSYFRFSNRYFILSKTGEFVADYEQYSINKIIEDYKEFYESEYSGGKKLVLPNESLKKDLIETDTIVKFLTEGNTKTVPCRLNKHWTLAPAVLGTNEQFGFEYKQDTIVDIPLDRENWWIFDDETMSLLGRDLDDYSIAPIIDNKAYNLNEIDDLKSDFYDKIRM